MKLEDLFNKYKHISSFTKENDENGVLNSLIVLKKEDDWVLPEEDDEFKITSDDDSLIVYTKKDMDILLEYVDNKIISFNIELKNKKELLNNKIKEMEELFIKNNFNELKNIEIKIK